MIDYYLFIASIVFIAGLVVGIAKLKQYEIKKGAMAGIIGFVLFFIILATVSQVVKAGEWFAYGELYAGLDAPKEKSPQCEPSGFDNGDNDLLTSNGGIRINIFKQDGFELNGYYLHKSCAINDDAETYDGIGVEVAYKMWGN